MQYQVLARKWRPQSFHEVVGQDHVSRTLINALKSDRVAHAFLFAGPRGSGKTTMARILAKALNCHGAKPGEPCGLCAACAEIAAGNCLDVMEIDAASNRGIDEIRELREKVRYSPARDRNKIFIIDEVHMLTPEAFNALLKTLEEPPPHVVFIMATTEYHKIPATILSRCQQHSFKLIPFPLILERLEKIALSEGLEITRSALEQIVFSSGGSMRDAMSALDQVIAFSGRSVKDEDVAMLLGLVEPALLGEVVRAIANNESDRILMKVGELIDSGQDLQNFCRRLLTHFRSLMVLKAGVSDASVLGVAESLLPDVRVQADLFSQEDLLRLFDALLKIEIELKNATQPRFQLEMGLIELAQLSRLRSLEELIAEFTRLVAQEQSPLGSGGGSTQRNSAPKAPGTVNRRSGPAARPGSASVAKRPATAPRRPAPPAAASARDGATEAPGDAAQGHSGDPRSLLLKIGAAVQKASLEPILQSLAGARIEGATVVFELGAANEFVRRQLLENVEVIATAASAVAGRAVTVRLGEGTERAVAQSPSTTGREARPEGVDILERAKRETVVRSFLDTFPGPVKAEKIDI